MVYYLNKTVMEMETKEDGCGVGVGDDGVADDGTNSGLGGGACFGVEADSELALGKANDQSENGGQKIQNQRQRHSLLGADNLGFLRRRKKEWITSKEIKTQKRKEGLRTRN